MIEIVLRDTLLTLIQVRRLHWIIQHDILSCQLQQHGVIEELVDGDIFRQALPPSCLHHEFTSLNNKIQSSNVTKIVTNKFYQSSCWLWFQRSDGDGFVQRISRNNLPVMEHGQTERLALGVCPEICLETE